MAYREKKIYSGKMLEVEIYPVTKKEIKQPRKEKTKLSAPKQQNLNDKNARKHLTRLINTNFTDKDLVLHLTYRDEELPRSEKEARRDVVNFLRRVKYDIKKKKLPELKYIAVIEYKEAEEGKEVRMHHHIIMSGDIDRDTVEELWGKGRANADRLKADEYGYEALANYISKDPKGSKRWTQSKNLKQPIVRVSDHKYTKRRVEKVATCPEDRETFEKLYPGYILTQCKVTVNDITAGTYLYIKMRKLKD